MKSLTDEALSEADNFAVCILIHNSAESTDHTKWILQPLPGPVVIRAMKYLSSRGIIEMQGDEQIFIWNQKHFEMLKHSIVQSTDEVLQKFQNFIYAPQLIAHVPNGSDTTPHACIQVIVRGQLGNTQEAIKRTIEHLENVLKYRRESHDD